MPKRRRPAAAGRPPRLVPPRGRAGGRGETAGQVLARALLVVIVIGCAALLLAASLAPSANVAAAVVGTLDGRIRDVPPLPDDLGEPPERSVILARDGSVLAILHDAENRKIVPLDAVPEPVQLAVLATEDAEFRTHSGVNWKSIARATLGNVAAGEITSGASTITQQLVKNLVVGGDVTLDRKLREAVYAMELEKRLTKDQILESYLNQAYFGNGVYGIGTAAEYYFGKPVGELAMEEAAVLAGLIRTPARNDPIRHPEAALQRRNIVLAQMVEAGFLDPAEAERLTDTPLVLNVSPLPEPRQPFFVDYVRHLLKTHPALGESPGERFDRVLRGGLTIQTTLDPRLQDIAQEVIAEVLHRSDDPLSALSAVDPRTGEVLAIAVGPKPYGDGPGETKVNPAVKDLGGSGRQPGSAFKAFMVVTALEQGISPAYTIDTPSPYIEKDKCRSTRPWHPGNYSDSGGGIMNMAEATARSSNVYFSHLVDIVGPDKLVATAQRMGITSQLDPNCSAVLGAEEVFPLDMASAFGTLANQGQHCAPYAITSIVDRRGNTIVEAQPTCEQVVERGVAARATALLRGPIENGTASRNGQIGRPAAGKTGTTDDYKDAWFTGFVPQLSTAVWVGFEQQRAMNHPDCGRVTGGCLPTMIWGRFMRRAVEALGLPVEGFPAPPPIASGIVPDVVGKLEDEAKLVVTEAKFSPLVEVVPDYRPAGTVIAQNPPGGTPAELGTAVLLSVSDGTGPPPVMPPLVGLQREDAIRMLQELGLDYEVSEIPVEDPRLHGVVVRQRPPAGSQLDPAVAVTLHVVRPRNADDPPPVGPSPSPTPTRPPPNPPPPPPSPSPSPTSEPTTEPSPSPSPEPTEEPTEGPPGQGGGGGQGGSKP